MRILAILFFLLSVTGTAVSSEYFNRVDCFPEPDVTAEKCTQRKCQWDPPGCDAPENTPPCYFPTTTGYTHVREETEDSNTVYILKRNIDLAENSKNPPNPYVNDDEREDDLKVSTSYYGPALRVRIEPNGDGKRYEPTSVLLDQKLSVENELHFKVIETDSIFSFTVERNSTGARLWDTSIGGMLFADQYIQIATLLPTDKMYGWGENAHQTLKHDFSKYKTWGMFGRDQPPQSVGEQTLNLYGVQPFYMALESDHKAHGVFILNANAQEVTTGPNSHFVYRTIGGILDIFFLPGPTPEEVVKQFEMLVGKPFMPAYFALGFQLSRYGYKDLDDMKAAVDRTINAGIPLEVPYADIDYMMHFTDFTLSERVGPKMASANSYNNLPKGFQQLGEYTKEIHSKGMKLFLMFDVGIDVTSPPFKRALEQGANFIQWPENNSVPKDVQSMYSTTNNTDFMLGVVWPNNHCAFPDFLDPENNTAEWWISEFREYHKNISFDGIWIDMNEPAVFGTNLDNPWYFTDPDHPYKIKPIYCNFTDNLKKYDYPKFKTHNVYVYDDDTLLLSDKTLCMRAKTNRGEQLLYDTKSLYALYEARYTHKALELVIGKRGAIITRANYPGIGQYSGHWLGDNNATWSDLLTSIVGIQEYNIFGIPYIGSDICGFHGNTTEELCLRWHQLGAFYTFSRNHNGKPYIKQDPAQWESVKSATKKAYNFRYRYLPYLYSLHFDAHLNGGSVIRPVFFEFPDDEKTHSLGMQFMWGKAMMIIPVYTEGDTSVEGYLPESSFWYSLRDDDYGYQVPNTQTNFSAKLDEMIPVFIRGSFNP
uniref:P-type domain-containing protein n=1 Tax=Syphacia muris TaxID=451379 RepID=A0A0N5ARH1_9BILA